MGWALHTQGGSRAWNSIQIWAGTTHTEPQHSPCVIPTDRTGSRIQSQLWKWFIIHARSTAVTYSTCPRPQDCVCSSRPCPAHQAHKSQTALGSSKDGDSPGKGVLIMSNFWIFTRNKWKLYKLDSLTQWDLMCRYCQLWRIKSPNFFFFFLFFPPQYSLGSIFFLQVAYRHTKLIQVSPTPKRISFDFVLSIKIYPWKSGSQNISFGY